MSSTNRHRPVVEQWSAIAVRSLFSASRSIPATPDADARPGVFLQADSPGAPAPGGVLFGKKHLERRGGWRIWCNVQRTMTVSAEEFIRRFLLHVLPKSFVRIRHFGFMANYQRSTSFELCRQLLKMAPVLPPAESTSATLVWLCPNCQTPLTVVERLTAAQIAWRFTAKCYLDTS